ncbi:hypothetical protein BO85DRAFT_484768 [Aspergillus piperis CBS 112811]|uniref:Uncharacterized protein n=1 Tax=Aspergillus piperis CBS 112811 TaxID=1448313 RepID=A0A8G1VQQ9_9EURO|nr:hypothetical protein BO85DRAFT_484768 [Aspergillus piperis CBS 112811]RAH61012.1 hypothetical protein BO85DRAFT_484768 [Aspergillus piperis CBS 112811]
MGIQLTSSPEGSRPASPVLECTLTAKAEASLAENCLTYKISQLFRDALGAMYSLVVYDKFGVRKLTLEKVRRFGVVERQLNYYLEKYPIEDADDLAVMRNDLQTIAYSYDP